MAPFADLALFSIRRRYVILMVREVVTARYGKIVKKEDDRHA